jgi:hypothetical protein
MEWIVYLIMAGIAAILVACGMWLLDGWIAPGAGLLIGIPLVILALIFVGVGVFALIAIAAFCALIAAAFTQ